MAKPRLEIPLRTVLAMPQVKQKATGTKKLNEGQGIRARLPRLDGGLNRG
jgi:hypothetical protein